ncbi:Uncharacterised protein [Klebsiella aerogenes]|nr:Uncharacterised protein [Klebsiella aerogenes]
MKELTLNEMEYISGGFNLFAQPAASPACCQLGRRLHSFVLTSGSAFASFVATARWRLVLLTGQSNWETFVTAGKENWGSFVNTAATAGNLRG